MPEPCQVFYICGHTCAVKQRPAEMKYMKTSGNNFSAGIRFCRVLKINQLCNQLGSTSIHTGYHIQYPQLIYGRQWEFLGYWMWDTGCGLWISSKARKFS